MSKNMGLTETDKAEIVSEYTRHLSSQHSIASIFKIGIKRVRRILVAADVNIREVAAEMRVRSRKLT